MQDVHIEDIIKRKPSNAARIFKIIFIILAVFCFCMAVLFIPIVFLIMAVVFAGLAYFYHNRIYVDYEYMYTNGDLSIDRVLNNIKRKRIVSMDMNDLEIVAPVGSDGLNGYSQKKLKSHDFTDHNSDSKVYCLIFRNQKNNNAEEMAFINPSAELLDAMWQINPHQVFKN